MSQITPRNQFPAPSEYEEPYYDSENGFHLAVDAATHSNAENSQLQFLSTGSVGWDATAVDSATGLLYWAADILMTAFSMPFRARLEGPASVQMKDGEVLYFTMPRLMTANVDIQLYRSNRIYLLGTKLPDLRLFAARVGSVIYFYNGKSLKDGDDGLLFSGGLATTSIFPAHQHATPVIIEPPSMGVDDLNVGMTAPNLMGVDLYRNGSLQSEPADYTLNLSTGHIHLVTPTTRPNMGDPTPERFVILIEERDTTHPTTTHTHLPALVVTPLAGTSEIEVLVTTPTLEGVDLFRNGLIQAEPDDYTLDPAIGRIHITTPSSAGEVFQVLRRVYV